MSNRNLLLGHLKAPSVPCTQLRFSRRIVRNVSMEVPDCKCPCCLRLLPKTVPKLPQPRKAERLPSFDLDQPSPVIAQLARELAGSVKAGSC